MIVSAVAFACMISTNNFCSGLIIFVNSTNKHKTLSAWVHSSFYHPPVSQLSNLSSLHFHYLIFYHLTKSEGYSFGVVRVSIPSLHTFCLSGTKSQYLLVRFHLFLEQMISTIDSRYPISLVKFNPLTLELLPLF